MTPEQAAKIEIFAVNGLAFGYPRCCIAEFINFYMNYPADQRSDDQTQIGKLNYGFIPCKEHAKAIIDKKVKIEDLIVDRHPQCKPFPNE